MVVNFLEFTNVAVLLHDAQELDDDLRTGPDHDLPLARLFGIVDALEGVIEDACSNHLEGGCLDEDGNDDDRRSGFEILKPVGMRYLVVDERRGAWIDGRQVGNFSVGGRWDF